MAILEEFIEFITTDAGSGDERAVADKLKAKLSALGCEVFEDPKEAALLKGNTGNVYAVLNGTADGRLLLCSHMDRVNNGHGIVPVIEDGVIHAEKTILAADDIAGVCAILDGLRRVKASGKPYPTIEMVFTCCEEDGIRGSRIMDYSRIKSEVGYIFDAPGRIGTMINSATTRVSFDIRIWGRSAHAANEPEKGINALLAAAYFLTRVPQGRLDSVSTANFSTVFAEGATNVVTDKARILGEMRSHDDTSVEKYISDVKALCEDIESNTGALFEVDYNYDFRHFFVPEDSECIVRAKKVFSDMDIDVSVKAIGGAMDANNFNEHGITSIGIATGYFENHTVREYLLTDDMIKAGEYAERLILEWAHS